MKKPAIKLVGISLGKKTTNQKNQSAVDCGMLWEKFQNEKIAERIHQKKGDAVFAVYYNYEGDYTQPYSYFIRQEVSENAIVMEGLQSIKIPAGEYQKITAKGEMPNCVADAWRNIWKQDDYPRAYKADFEVYDQRSADWQKAEVDIFIGQK